MLIPRLEAISLLDFPSASRRTTSRSRAVSACSACRFTPVFRSRSSIWEAFAVKKGKCLARGPYCFQQPVLAVGLEHISSSAGSESLGDEVLLVMRGVEEDFSHGTYSFYGMGDVNAI